jgi:hypothetical protein
MPRRKSSVIPARGRGISGAEVKGLKNKEGIEGIEDGIEKCLNKGLNKGLKKGLNKGFKVRQDDKTRCPAGSRP